MTQYPKQPEGGLLQSQEWADFLCAEGHVVVEDGENFGVINTVPIVGKYLYIPRFMEQKKGNAKQGGDFMKKMIDIAREYGCVWVRMDLLSLDHLQHLEQALVIQHLQLRKAPHDMQPRQNFIIHISPDEKDLLAQMKSKTRYNIRLAQKKGVQVQAISNVQLPISKNSKQSLSNELVQGLDAFYTMVEQTARRKGVTFHAKEHYVKMFESLPSENIALYVARYNDEIIAANIMTFYGGTATYLHGATSDQHRRVMAPFLLQWVAIKDARERGCQWYDFGGVYPEATDPGKAGITRFKNGFAPQTDPTVFPGSYDLVVQPGLYWLYRTLQKVRGWMG